MKAETQFSKIEAPVSLLFDNDGGVTFQSNKGRTHRYDDMGRAAKDYFLFVREGNTDNWEIHETSGLYSENSYDDFRCVYDREKILKEAANFCSSGWKSIDQFCIAFNKFQQSYESKTRPETSIGFYYTEKTPLKYAWTDSRPVVSKSSEIIGLLNVVNDRDDLALMDDNFFCKKEDVWRLADKHNVKTIYWFRS